MKNTLRMILVLVLAAQASLAQLSSEAWREDLQVLAETLREKHRNPFHHVARQDFDNAVATLERRLPELEEHEIIAEFARLVALLRDGHTRLSLPLNLDHLGFNPAHSTDLPPHEDIGSFHVLPVRLYLYEDGLFVRQTAVEHRDLLGARVLEIGRMPAAEAMEMVRPLLAVENEAGFQIVAPTRLVIPEILVATGITEPAASTRFVVQRTDGETIEVELRPLAPDAEPQWTHVREIHGARTPLWQRDTDAYYWFEAVPETSIVYVQLNRIDNDPEESLTGFVRRLFDFVEGSDTERLVLDLRHNSGGIGQFIRPLVLALIRWDKATEPGHLFVVTGRKTFSAAIHLVTTLEQYTHVTFVGESIGGRPNHYGDPKKTQLPRSGLTLRTSTIYWRDWTEAEGRESAFLELPAPLSSRDDALGRDPAMEAILSLRQPEELTEHLTALDARAGIDSAAILFYRLSTDPGIQVRGLEEAMNTFGTRLLGHRRHREAQYIFGINADVHPRSAAAHGGLGEALFALGSMDEARTALEKALELDPGNGQVRKALEKLKEGR